MTIHVIVSWFLALGLAGVFAITFAEKFVPVVPSYVMLMLLGMTAARPSSLLVLVAVSAAGSLCASVGWYAIGRVLGERRVERAVARWGHFVLFRPASYLRLASAYRRNRFWVTLVGQTVPVARVYLGLPAGVLRLRPLAFALPAALGILCWNVPFLTLGFVLKGGSHSPEQVGVWASVILIAAEVLILFVVSSIRRARHRGGRPL